MRNIRECYRGVDGLLYVIYAALSPGVPVASACVWIVPELNGWEC